MTAPSPERLTERIRELGDEIGRLLHEREDLYAIARDHGLVGSASDPSSMQWIADALAERIGMPPPRMPVVPRRRDETGFWTNLDSLEGLVRAFLPPHSPLAGP
jgi:hypothetical protein